jgi:hypothetical protein
MRVQASLVVLSESLDAPTITRRIGTFPDESWKIGDAGPGGASQRHNGWSVAVSSETGALSECLDELLDRVRPHGRHIAALVSDGVAHARLWLYLAGESKNQSITLESRQLHDIMTMGAALTFDVYVL